VRARPILSIARVVGVAHSVGMRDFASSFAVLFASLLAVAGCSNTAAPGTDAGHGAEDTGSGGTDAGADAGAPSIDAGTDAGPTGSDAGIDAASSTTDAGALGCLFRGAYHATNIRCNGAPYAQAAALTPPSGSWTVSDDGTHATFTTTIGSCSLIATGHILCDSPAVGQFTHHPDAPLTCSPAACSPFASACSGSTVGADATWSYTRNADGSIEASTSASAIHTCTGAGQSNPVQITWVPS
jgi:hypothetical protein